MLQGSDPIEAVFIILVLLFSIVAHEVSHGYAALALGDKTALYAGRLTLNPLKHIDPIGSILVPMMTLMAGFGFGWAKPVPYNPANLRDKRWGDTKVALSGPLTNFGIALAFALIARLGSGIIPEQAVGLMVVVVWINIALGVFNMIPVPPFDGSKLLMNILPYRYQYIFDYMQRYWFVTLLLIVLFAGGIISPVVRSIFSLFMGGV
jgi:Zn-dependent protease